MEKVTKVFKNVKRTSQRKRDKGSQGEKDNQEICEEGLCSLGLCISGKE